MLKVESNMQNTHPVCPSCWKSFSGKGSNYQPLPMLLLSCGHSFCEPCLMKLAQQQRTAIMCPLCQSMTNLTEEGSTKNLTVDLYSHGELYFMSKNITILGQSRNTPVSMIQKILHTKATREPTFPETGIQCCSECNKQATCRCVKCECNLCTVCFEQIHQTSKMLRKHQAIPLYEDDSIRTDSMCSLHQNRLFEFYCDDCEVNVCSHCIVRGPHQNHSVTTMEERNQTATGEMEEAVKEATSVWRRLKRAQKTMGQMVPGVRTAMERVAREIHDRFRHLHAILQVREMELMSQLTEKCEKEMVPLEEMRHKIEIDVRKLERIVKDADKAMNNHSQLVLNARFVLDRLREVSSVPCVLQAVESDQAVRCSFPDKLSETLSQIGSVEGGSSVRAELKFPQDVPDLPDDVGDTEPQSLVIQLDSEEAVDSISEVSSQGALSPCSQLGSTADSSEFKKERQLGRIHFKKSEGTNVQLSHIKDPGYFMVHRNKDLPEIQRLSRNISLWAINPQNYNSHVPQKLLPGDLVLATWGKDKAWYRGRVQQVNKSGPTARVLFVDYGNSAWLPFTSMRTMPNVFYHTPAFATQCCLWDLVPSGEASNWSKEAIKEFATICGEKTLNLIVFKEADDVLHVDLRRPASHQVEGDIPVSVREALVFLEIACYVHEQPGSTCSRTTRQFISPELPLRNSRHGVMISHVDSPKSFYVQKIKDDAHSLAQLMVEIQEQYSKVKKIDPWTILCPQIDEVCVAQFSEDNAWYRAQVIGLPGRRRVQIRYVDFGNMELVPYWKLRKITEKFQRLPIMALHCSLVDVAPVKSDGKWNQAAELMREFMQKDMIICTKGINGRKLDVILYDSDGKCLNSLLVEHGAAISTGPGSAENSTEPVSLKRHPVPGLLTGKRVASAVPPAGHPTQIYPNTSPAPLPAPSTAATTHTGDRREKPTTPKVVISHVMSPGHFYLQLVQASADLEEYMDKLQNDYAESEQVFMGWEASSYCAARMTQGHRWYRAKIQSTPDEDKVQVLAIDFGFQETVDVRQLRPLVSDRQKPGAYAFRCHLSGIQPTGTTDLTLWSQTSTEYLQCLSREHVFYIEQKGVRQEESLPVDLILEQFVKGDALTGDTVEYKSVAKLIVNKGLALPKRELPFKKPGEPGRERPVISKPPQPAVDSHAVDRPPTPLDTSRNRTSSISSQCSSSSSLLPKGCAEISTARDAVETLDENTAKVVSAPSPAEYSTEPAASSEQVTLGVDTDLALSICRSPAASEASHSSVASAVTATRTSISSTSPVNDDLSVEGERTSECEVHNLLENLAGQGFSAAESFDSHSPNDAETVQMEGGNVVGKKDTDYSDQAEKTPVKNSRIPSPPRPTRVVHGGIRTKAFFSNLPIQQNSSVSDAEALADELTITAAPIENSKCTTENISLQLHCKDITQEIIVSPGGSDKETLIDSPGCGSALEEVESYETCSEDGTEQFTEDNSSVVLEPKHVVDIENEPRSDMKDCKGFYLQTASVESSDGSAESKIKPETDGAGKHDVAMLTPIEGESTEKAVVSCSDKVAVGEDVGCEITIEKDEHKLEIETTSTIRDLIPDLNLEDKAKVEVTPEVDKENVPPPLVDATLDVEENSEIAGMFEENYFPISEDNVPEGEISEVAARVAEEVQHNAYKCEDYGTAWKPPDPVNSDFIGVPTYVGWDGSIYVHRVYDYTSVEGRFGFLLRENTVETVIQNSYLSQHSLYRAHIPRDGNCLFRAFAEAMYHDQGQQEKLRDQAVQTVVRHWDNYKVGIDETNPGKYAEKMGQSGTFGGEAEIQALCWLHNVRALVYLGGLSCPVTCREYGNTEDLHCLQLIYISDGNYDAGHYDLVVKSPDQSEEIEQIYQVWRQQKMQELLCSCDPGDYKSYDDSLLGQLMGHMQKVYATSQPDLNAHYNPGQAVVVLFAQDEQFYRAVIREVVGEQYKVQHVDFGNCETVGAEDLRSEVILQEVPVQCQRCELDGITPLTSDGKWPCHTLVHMHDETVGTSCSFEIQGVPSQGEAVKVKLKLQDGRDLSKELIMLGLATDGVLREMTLPHANKRIDEEEDWGDHSTPHEYKDETCDGSRTGDGFGDFKDVSHNYDLPENPPDRTVPTPYSALEIEVDADVVMIVTQIDTPDRLYLQLDEQESGAPGAKYRNQLLQKLETLSFKLQEDAPQYPKLKVVRPGTPCVCKFSHDEFYYRAEVISIHHSSVSGRVPLAGIRFIDYGSFEYVPTDKLYQIPAERMDLPAMGLPVKVAGLRQAGNNSGWHPRMKIWLGQLFANKKLLVKVKSVEPEILVELYDYQSVECGSAVLTSPYQPLIDEGLVEIDGTVCDQEGVLVEEEYTESVESDTEEKCADGDIENQNDVKEMTV